jgi:AcrR family transcriptional regulator
MPVVRRTNEQRSAETRARILDATIDCLAELGYARTTTTEIADRAGVSRGAQLHHYPTKAELVTAAMGHLFDQREQEFRTAIAKVPPGPDRASRAIDLLWSIVSGRTFFAWLELAVAARTDEELRTAMNVLSARTTANIQRVFQELFPPPAQPSPIYQLVPYFVFSVMHGIALDQLVVRDEKRWPDLLDLLKKLSTLVVPGGTP